MTPDAPAAYVGIDVAKDSLDVHARPTGLAFRVANDEAGIATLLARLHDLRPAALVLEATGGYEVRQHPHTAGSLPRLFMVSGPGLTIDNRP